MSKLHLIASVASLGCAVNAIAEKVFIIVADAPRALVTPCVAPAPTVGYASITDADITPSGFVLFTASETEGVGESLYRYNLVGLVQIATPTTLLMDTLFAPGAGPANQYVLVGATLNSRAVFLGDVTTPAIPPIVVADTSIPPNDVFQVIGGPTVDQFGLVAFWTLNTATTPRTGRLTIEQTIEFEPGAPVAVPPANGFCLFGLGTLTGDGQFVYSSSCGTPADQRELRLRSLGLGTESLLFSTPEDGVLGKASVAGPTVPGGAVQLAFFAADVSAQIAGIYTGTLGTPIGAPTVPFDVELDGSPSTHDFHAAATTGAKINASGTYGFVAVRNTDDREGLFAGPDPQADALLVRGLPFYIAQAGSPIAHQVIGSIDLLGMSDVGAYLLIADIADADGASNCRRALLLTLPPGDLTGDGIVSAADLAILLGAWGSSGPGDLDDDGTVGPADLAILLGLWTI